jgi:hypothetical protein
VEEKKIEIVAVFAHLVLPERVFTGNIIKLALSSHGRQAGRQAGRQVGR